MIRIKTHWFASVALALGMSQSAHAISLLSGLGGERGYGELAMTPNDDQSSSELNLPFAVKFFGKTYTTFFINNNGNVTFDGPFGAFTPNPFPTTDRPMIAPYWSDVQTEGTHNDPNPNGDNNVWVASPNERTVVVTWDRVGYFLQHTDLTNDFQLVLRDRSADTGVAGDFDVDFRYNRLEWTTGDASGGSGGLGGVAAQAGYDAGDGVHHLTLPGSLAPDVLNLQNASNVSPATPGLWSFAIRNGELPGGTPSNPLLPVTTPTGYSFEFNVQANTQAFIDPAVAVGYDYILSSGPNFASVLLPIVGDNLYDLWLWDGTNWAFDQALTGGTEFFFAAGGVDRFRILGIEPEANLDPNDPTAFVTGLTFAGGGNVSLSMNPIVVNVPEPGILFLFGLGLPLMRPNKAASRSPSRV